jgi:hypothetical protein
VRKVILKNLDKDYEECMLYGMIGYAVPHRVWPTGYRCDPTKPLMMAGAREPEEQPDGLPDERLRRQGRGARVVRDGVGESRERGWRTSAAAPCGSRRPRTPRSEVIGEAIRRTPAKAYVATYMENCSQVPDAGRTARACEEAEQGDIPAAARGGKAAKKATKKKTTKASAKR